MPVPNHKLAYTSPSLSFLLANQLVGCKKTGSCNWVNNNVWGALLDFRVKKYYSHLRCLLKAVIKDWFQCTAAHLITETGFAGLEQTWLAATLIFRLPLSFFRVFEDGGWVPLFRWLVRQLNLTGYFFALNFVLLSHLVKKWKQTSMNSDACFAVTYQMLSGPDDEGTEGLGRCWAQKGC